MGRFIGLDIHRDFAQVAAVEDGLVTDPLTDATRVPIVNEVTYYRLRSD